MSIRQWLACRRLAKLVAKQRKSFEVQDFGKRREAAKRGWAMRNLRSAALSPFGSSPVARSRSETTDAIASRP